MMRPPLRVTCLIFFSSLCVAHAQDKPNIIDQVLQVAWEPSSLIRLWTALDQLYNIGLGWRRAARTLVTLPFGGEGRSTDHVRIQTPRRHRALQHKLDMPHWERFHEVYSGPQQVLGSNNRPAIQTPGAFEYALPPPFLFQPQETFLDWGGADWSAFHEVSALLENRDRLLLQKLRSRVPAGSSTTSFARPVLSQRKEHSVRGVGGNAPPMFFFGSNTNPETRLRLFLRLMGDLGRAHSSQVKKASGVKFDDDTDYFAKGGNYNR